MMFSVKNLRKHAAITLSLAGALSSPGFAQDGKTLYTTKLCHTCHGEEGKKPTVPLYPKINGQSKAYLVAQIKDIKSGARANGMSMVMKPMVQALTDAEIDAIAEWLSKLN